MSDRYGDKPMGELAPGERRYIYCPHLAEGNPKTSHYHKANSTIPLTENVALVLCPSCASLVEDHMLRGLLTDLVRVMAREMAKR